MRMSAVTVAPAVRAAAEYDADTAARVLEEFLECRLSLEGFWTWLRRFPYYPGGAPDPPVEDVLNQALLAVSALRRGERPWPEVRAELLDARGRLSGLARHRQAPPAPPGPGRPPL
jgi:hypothetical protein